MVFKSPSGLSSSKIPETQGLVPGAGKGIVSITGEHNIRDEVGVTVKSLLRDSIVSFIPGELPND